MRFVLSVFLALAGLGCAHSSAWSARTLAGCKERTGVPELDRERAYLASLLALDSRRYAVVRHVQGRELEATYASDYPASQPHWRCVLSVLDDASVVLDVPSTTHDVSKREAQWADKLVFSIEQYQCRELDWLRWEAQNRGLMGVGADAPAPPIGATSGAALSASVPLPAEANRAAQIAALREERAKLHIARPAAASGVGLGVFVFGTSLLAQGLVYRAQGCAEPEFAGDEPDCTSRDAGKVLAPIGGAAMGAGGIMLAIAVPFLVRRLHEARALNQRIKALQTLQVGSAPQPAGAGIVVRGAF
jgi:hypothetical protein